LQLANLLGSDVYKAGAVLVEYYDQGIAVHVEARVWPHEVAQVRLVHGRLLERYGTLQIGLHDVEQVVLLQSLGESISIVTLIL